MDSLSVTMAVASSTNRLMLRGYFFAVAICTSISARFSSATVPDSGVTSSLSEPSASVSLMGFPSEVVVLRARP